MVVIQMVWMRAVLEELLVKVWVQVSWLMAQEASHFVQEIVAAGYMWLGQEEELKLQDAVATNVVNEEEPANQHEEQVQQNYNWNQ